ncbi:hypothetical protein [Arthrobacter koreensis]|uniref:hypothetical protein n=1 Tax=Arthrobacter koreensis TaxID=199136 RepID=UPI0036D88680
MKLMETLGKSVWVLLVILAVVVAVILEMTGPHQWGDVPTWVATVGTLGSFWVALAIYYVNSTDKRYAPARLVSVYTMWGKSVERSQAVNVWNGQGFTEMPDVEPKPIVEYPQDIPPELAAGLMPGSAGGLSRTVKRVKFAIENGGEHAIHHIRIDQGFPDSSSIRTLSRSYLTLRPHGILRPVFHFEEDLNLEGLRPRVYFTDALNRRWCSEPGYPVRPARKGEGEYEGTGSLDFLNEDLPAHEGGAG